MAIRINNLHLSLDEDNSELKRKASKKLRISPNEIKELIIIKKSIDARKKNDIKFNFCVDVICVKVELRY